MPLRMENGASSVIWLSVTVGSHIPQLGQHLSTAWTHCVEAPTHCECVLILGLIEIRFFFSCEVLLKQFPLLSNCVFDIFSWPSESKCRYIYISIKCHILFSPFVLAQSFQTLFLSFVPLYIFLSIVLFANLVAMFFIFQVSDKK